MTTFHLPRFTVVNGETVSEGLVAYGVFEAALTEAFLRLIQPDWTLVDVGMHLGYYTTLFARLVGPRGAVHAFEPTPNTRRLAAENIQPFGNVTVHPFAVWSSARQMTFHDFGPQWMAFNSFTAARMKSGPPPPKEFVAQTITLDAFRSQVGREIKLVKIDAESAELEILKGARTLLQTDLPLISLEVGDSEGATQSRQIVEFLRELHYKAWEFAHRRFILHAARERYEYDNLIFAPAGCDLSSL